MSAKSVKSRLNKLKALALPVSMLVLLGNGSAFAGQTNYRTLLSQTDSNGDIIIDDEPNSRDSSGSTTPSSRTDNLARFGCETYNGEYTVMYYPLGAVENKRPWAKTQAMGGGWDAQSRCMAIKDRLESYRPEGLLELKTGRENNMNILCATTEANPNLCKIVLTVPNNLNPAEVRDRVFDNLIAADSGEITAPVNTFNGQGSSILNRIGGMLNKNRPTGGDINLRNQLVPGDRGGAQARPQQGGNQTKPGSGRLFKKGL